MNQAPNRFQIPSSQQAVADAKGMVGDALCSATNTIKSNPATAVLTAFGAGLGLGIGLALVFGGTSAPPPGMREQFTQFLNEHMPSWARS